MSANVESVTIFTFKDACFILATGFLQMTNGKISSSLTDRFHLMFSLSSLI